MYVISLFLFYTFIGFSKTSRCYVCTYDLCYTDTQKQNKNSLSNRMSHRTHPVTTTTPNTTNILFPSPSNLLAPAMLHDTTAVQRTSAVSSSQFLPTDEKPTYTYPYAMIIVH